MADCAFYSTDITPTTDPASADPAPATLVVLDQPPVFGDYQADDTTPVRGVVISTLGGAVVQDFGETPADGRIYLSEPNALSAATVSDLATIATTSGTQYYFTDGFSVWKVQFSRPNGFRAYKSLFWRGHGADVYGYEIHLVVIYKEV